MKKITQYQSKLNNFIGSKKEVTLNDKLFLKEQKNKENFQFLKEEYQNKIDSFRNDFDVSMDPGKFLLQKIKEVGHLFDNGNFPNNYDEYKMLTSKKRERYKTTLRYTDFIDIKIDLHDGIRELSNSHSCPIGKKTNWSSRDNNEPTSYPGFSGYIHIEITKEAEKYVSFTSNFLKIFPINTGSGGGASIKSGRTDAYALQYDIKFFIDDFPKIKDVHSKFQDISGKVQKSNKVFRSEVSEKISQDPEITAEKVLLSGWQIKLNQITTIISNMQKNISKLEKQIETNHIGSYIVSKEELQEYEYCKKYFKELY